MFTLARRAVDARDHVDHISDHFPVGSVSRTHYDQIQHELLNYLHSLAKQTVSQSINIKQLRAMCYLQKVGYHSSSQG